MDLSCVQIHTFEKCGFFFPTLFRRLPSSVQEEMFGNGAPSRDDEEEYDDGDDDGHADHDHDAALGFVFRKVDVMNTVFAR